MVTWSRIGKACFGVMACVAIGFGSIAGCSSDNAAPQQGTDAGLVCPTSIADVGKACTVEGKSCPTGYACGSFNQQAQCTCTGGKFHCTDATGVVLNPGDTPACVPNGDGNDSRCPASEQKADLASCNVSGLLCRYAGQQCPEKPAGQPNQDVCMCSVPQAGGPLVFHCEPTPCNPRGDASDEGLVPPVDASDSATPDASDGSPADAPHEGG